MKKPIPKHLIVLPLLILIGAGAVYSFQGWLNNVENYINQGIQKYNIQDFRKSADLYKQQGKESDYQDALNRIKQLGK